MSEELTKITLELLGKSYACLIDERGVLQKKLELAIDFMTFQLIHEYDIDEYNMFHKPTCRKCAADKVLKEINEIK
jgi:hypothetical protein